MPMLTGIKYCPKPQKCESKIICSTHDVQHGINKGCLLPFSPQNIIYWLVKSRRGVFVTTKFLGILKTSLAN